MVYMTMNNLTQHKLSDTPALNLEISHLLFYCIHSRTYKADISEFRTRIALMVYGLWYSNSYKERTFSPDSNSITLITHLFSS